MLSVDQLKNSDPELRDLSDDDIVEIRAKLYALAELALDCWVDQVREAASDSKTIDGDRQNDGHGTLST